MNEPFVAVLGRRDDPTDAVEEYCHYLADGLKTQGMTLEIARVNWAEAGWRSGLHDFLSQYPNKEGRWFILQYTALAWSRRGIPLRFISVLRRLKKQGAKCAVVFHDVEAYRGARLIDQIRYRLQIRTMRRATLMADVSIFTVPMEKISWVDRSSTKNVFIPVGANLPHPEKAWTKAGHTAGDPPTVGVFSITGGDAWSGEAKEIADAVLFAAKEVGSLRVVLLGRNSEGAESYFAERFKGSAVQLKVHGILPAEQVVEVLGSCDVLLFVRAQISSRRGSAIAGIACGLPIVARAGWETAEPITHAGLEIINGTDPSNTGKALLRVLSDDSYRAVLAQRSRRAQTRYFSWEAISSEYMKVLAKSEAGK